MSHLLKRAKIVLAFIGMLTFALPLVGQVAVDTAIDFNVKDVDSQSHHLFSYLDENKIVVLDFFTTNCGPCQAYASEVSAAYEYFGCNEGNVIFLGINWGSDNDLVREFDSLWGAHYPSVSGLQGNGNKVVEDYQVLSYPTVILITPDQLILHNYIWPPSFDTLVNLITQAGGIENECTVSTDLIEIPPVSYLTMTSSGEIRVNLEGSKITNARLELYTIDGKLLWQKAIDGKGVYIQSLPSGKGIYIARLIEGSQVYTAKYVK